jgi:hypothetical protein
MDVSIIPTIASTIITLLVPYLMNFGESVLKKAGEDLNSKVGELAQAKVKQIYEKIKMAFSSEPSASEAIESLEKFPDNADIQVKLREQLEARMVSDRVFAMDLIRLLVEADKAGVDSVFSTTVHGKVEKIVQMGDVYGNVSIK